MSVRALRYSGGWGHQTQERPVSVGSGGWGRQSQERPASVCALQYSGGWGRQSQERPVSVRALQYSGGWGHKSAISMSNQKHAPEVQEVRQALALWRQT